MGWASSTADETAVAKGWAGRQGAGGGMTGGCWARSSKSQDGQTWDDGYGGWYGRDEEEAPVKQLCLIHSLESISGIPKSCDIYNGPGGQVGHAVSPEVQWVEMVD
jgi:hypothetical protein